MPKAVLTHASTAVYKAKPADQTGRGLSSPLLSKRYGI